MRTVIIDNESNVTRLLLGLLAHYCPEVSVVGTADSLESGLKLIFEVQPDLALLDVEMNDGTGIELVQKLKHKNLKVIFITAHDKYALAAFRCSAIDFLLKPVDPDELVKAIAKVKQAQRFNGLEQQLAVLTEHLSGSSLSQRKIVLSDQESIHIVKIEDIIWCLAEGSYTRFKLITGPEIFVSKNLKSYEDILQGHEFIRIHNSYLVNINHIKRFEKGEGGTVVMSNNDLLPVSVRKKDTLMTLLKNWNRNTEVKY
ncbi:MAG: DNA-binding response regulator [Cytophagales bacterium CG12_big_fil_rev_8_21_14_0_65_40_12]|nr:MAG: DNA-binding response regulator [Cytophagales bacterium CG12_big_fil_rev_8_21_14_0_65_40_12]PIW03301.1 MAG: DNA-binding response regulator [Cytophagales bacterium CG17_big_fil_post_rev_8_21_14_2_50_40_13]